MLSTLRKSNLLSFHQQRCSAQCSPPGKPSFNYKTCSRLPQVIKCQCELQILPCRTEFPGAHSDYFLECDCLIVCLPISQSLFPDFFKKYARLSSTQICLKISPLPLRIHYLNSLSLSVLIFQVWITIPKLQSNNGSKIG